MPKINVYVPDDLAVAVREAGIPVSAVCQLALEQALSDLRAAERSGSGDAGPPGGGPGDDAADAEGRSRFGLLHRFTPRAREAIASARERARSRRNGHVGVEHLLHAVLADGENVAARAVDSMGVDRHAVLERLDAVVPAGTAKAKGRLPFRPSAKAALGEAAKTAIRMRHNYIGCEHLLLGVLAVAESPVAEVLAEAGIESQATRRAVATLLAGVADGGDRPAAARAEPGIDELLARIEALEQRLPPS